MLVYLVGFWKQRKWQLMRGLKIFCIFLILDVEISLKNNFSYICCQFFFFLLSILLLIVATMWKELIHRTIRRLEYIQIFIHALKDLPLLLKKRLVISVCYRLKWWWMIFFVWFQVIFHHDNNYVVYQVKDYLFKIQHIIIRKRWNIRFIKISFSNFDISEK